MVSPAETLWIRVAIYRCGKVFSQACVKNSVRGCVSQHALGQTRPPPVPSACWDTHPWADTPLGRHPTRADTPVADLRGARGMHAPLGAQILSMSCSFWENMAKSYVGAPVPPTGSWHPLIGEILDPPLHNPPPPDGHYSGRYASYWNASLSR